MGFILMDTVGKEGGIGRGGTVRGWNGRGMKYGVLNKLIKKINIFVNFSNLFYMYII